MRKKHRHRAGFMQNGARTAIGITKTGIVAGGGAMGLAAMSAGTGAGVATVPATAGLANLSAQLPAAGTIGGVGMVLGGVSEWGRMIKKKKK